MYKKYLFLLLLTIFVGCYSFSSYENVTQEGVNSAIMSDSEFRFITKGNSEYRMNIEYIDSVTVSGCGLMRYNEKDEWRLFSGKVKLDSINIIEYKKKGYGKSILLNYSAFMVVGMYVVAIGVPNDAKMNYETYPGSCPFIYSWNGEKYVLDGEAYGIGIGKALELNTVTMLPSLKSKDSLLHVKITNERPETHYTNRIKLYAMETEENVTPVMDAENTPWPVVNPVSPVKAIDHSGNSILQSIQSADNDFWESDLKNTNPLTGFEDVLELTFARSQISDTASLIIRAINTKLINSAYDQMYGYLGDSALRFSNALETDEIYIQKLKDWIHFGAIRVSVWSEDGWRDAGIVYPEANEVAFSKLVRLDLSNTQGEEIKVRLKSMTDVWKIDAVEMDYTPAQRLVWKELDLLTVNNLNNKNIRAEIENDDEKYAITLPSQEIDLTYKNIPKNSESKLYYALSVKGYLHEWISKPTERQVQFGNSIPNPLEHLKTILSYKELLLPPIYADWKKNRYRYYN
jgi:hypothetical protein